MVGTSGNAHAVRLFPGESCTCPSTNTCYHILAARMSIGLIDKSFKKRINLTQLRRNTRPKTQKKSGRKAPRPDDYDTQPAPDSISNEKRYVKEHGIFLENQMEKHSQIEKVVITPEFIEDEKEHISKGNHCYSTIHS